MVSAKGEEHNSLSWIRGEERRATQALLLSTQHFSFRTQPLLFPHSALLFHTQHFSPP